MVRLVTICDIFGALIERRAYKPPLDPEEALSILQRWGRRSTRPCFARPGPYLSSATGPTRAAA
jgi:response regulator RpfG family c-di-GMP phosphodiesterase